MKILILGAGLLGTASAYILAQRGHEVTVVEKMSGPGMDTSFANGGQLSYSHAEPWANPGAVSKIMKWLGKEDAPLKFRLSTDPLMWAWSLKFLANCRNEKALYNTRNTLRLALYSRQVLHELIEETKIDFHYLRNGILHIFKDTESLAAAEKLSRYQEPLGCPFEMLTPDQCIEKEPALSVVRPQLVGGVFYPLDESGDIHVFTQKLSKKNPAITWQYNTSVKRIQTQGSQIASVETTRGTMNADMYVMALGSYSAVYMRQIGIWAQIYPMKGYSISIPLKEPSLAPSISLTDQSEKVVFSRLNNILRVAGTAEFAGYDHSINTRRVAYMKKLADRMFPGAGDMEKTTEWACLRPSTPQGTPLLGKTPYSNLVLNTGHGTLGCTLGPGSCKIVADIIEGKVPEIDLEGLTL